MTGTFQPLDQKFPIVGSDGTPTDYFIRWAQQRQIDISEGITEEQAQQLIADWAAARQIIAGLGLDGGGPLSADVTIDHSASLVVPGTYGDATHVPQFAVDQEGHIQGVVLVEITGGGAVVWGGITGTLSDQTDLQDALDEKANLTGGNSFSDNQEFTGDAITVSMPGVNTILDVKGRIQVGQDFIFTPNADFYPRFLMTTTSEVNRFAIFGGTESDVAAYIDADEMFLENLAENKVFIHAKHDLVALFYENTEKLRTTAAGVTITGYLTANVFDATHGGPVPLSGGGTANFLRADGAWAAPPGSGGGSGSITASGYTQSTGTILYRKTAGSGAIEEQSLATLKTDLGLTGTNSGDQFTAMTTARLLGRTTAGAGNAEEIVLDTDTALSANSDVRVATQKAVKAYVDATVSVGGSSSSGVHTLTTTYADTSNVTTVETDLFSYLSAAGELAVNGDRIEAQYSGIFVSSAIATRQLKVYFGGTAIFDTGALTLSLSSAWDVSVTIIRVDANTIRYAISMTTEGAALAAYTATGQLAGLTLGNTNILKLTGTAAGTGAATGDITGKLSAIGKWPAIGGSGGNWWFVPPAASSFALISGDATNLTLTDNTDVGLLMDSGTSVSGDKIRGAVRTLTNKALDWEMIARLDIPLVTTNFTYFGLLLYDSVGGRALGFKFDNSTTLNASHWNNLGSYNANGATIFNIMGGNMNWFRAKRVGANISYYFSGDGKAWTLFLTESTTAWLANAPDKVGIFIGLNRVGGLNVVGSCPYFSLTGPAV